MAFNLTSETIANRIEKEKSSVDKMIREKREALIAEQKLHYEIEALNKSNLDLKGLQTPPSDLFRALTKDLWSQSSLFKKDAARLLNFNISKAKPKQCNDQDFWEEHVKYGSHLSWDQWFPIFETVQETLQQKGVDKDSYVLFAQVFLAHIDCSAEQRGIMFDVLQDRKNNPDNTMLKSLSERIAEKHIAFSQKLNRKETIAQQLKKNFKG